MGLWLLLAASCPISNSCCVHALHLGLVRTVYIRFIFGVLGGETTNYTIMYVAYIRFWPTLITLLGASSSFKIVRVLQGWAP